MTASGGFLTVEEVAQHLQVEPPYVLDLIRDGRLPAVIIPPRPGSGESALVRIAPEHLSRFLRFRLHPELKHDGASLLPKRRKA
jgi:excisionase family DNA binding protein